jgi:hypothetical protein
MEALEAFNQAIFLVLNATPATPHWLIVTGVLIADYAIWVSQGGDSDDATAHGDMSNGVEFGAGWPSGL